MVSYTQVKASNAKITSDLPASLVAVFVGATNGIGEYTLKQFAKHATSPRVYLIGRSPEAGPRIAAECSKLNEGGSFTFIKADTSLIRNVDQVCKDIKSKESSINLLFLSTGTLDFYTDTSEGLRLASSLVHFSRTRFIHQLLPELQAATSLKRVVSVFAATKEGPLFIDDLNATKVPVTKARGHAASLVTAGMMQLAQQAPDVSFVHTFPGPVKSGIARDMPGIVGTTVRGLAVILGPVFNIPTDESGAYHLFFATSDRYSPKKNSNISGGMVNIGEVIMARAIDGVSGGGMYCIDQKGETASTTVEQLMKGYQQDGTVDKVWQYTVDEWERIVGKSSD